MANHPLVLALRFGLELAALAAYGIWGWQAGEGPLRFALAAGLPLLAALIWGAVVSPRAFVEAPGAARLLVEAAFFGGAVLALFATGAHGAALTMLALIVGHEIASYDRIAGLLRGGRS